MNLGLAAPRSLAVVALVILTSVSLLAPAASAGQERVYLDVNQPHYADVDELVGDADLIVMGTVAATVSQTGGRMLQEVHTVNVTHTMKGQPHEALAVVQDVGSTDGAVHVEGQHLLEEGADYVLALAAEGQHFRTVGGAQGVFVLAGSGWVSAAPSREDLALGHLDLDATDQAGPTTPPVVTVPPGPSVIASDPPGTTPRSTSSPPRATTMPTVIDGPSSTPLAPVEAGARDPSAETSGPRAWLLALVFLGGLALGAAATAFALARRRASATSRAQAEAERPQTVARGSAATRAPGHRITSDSARAAVQGLIAVTDLTDSPVLLAQVERSLRQAGVEIVTATEGQPFDTQWHHGVGVVPAPRPELDLRVARVVRPGWRTADGLLRPVEVEVYRADSS